jgi:hypothetical protein
MYEFKVALAAITWLMSWLLAAHQYIVFEAMNKQADYSIPVLFVIVASIATTLAVTDERVR